MGKKIVFFIVFVALAVSAFGEMLYIVKEENGNWGVIDQNMKYFNEIGSLGVYTFDCTEPPLDDEGIILTGRSSFTRKNEYGFVDKTGTIPPGLRYELDFTNVRGFSEGLAAVEKFQDGRRLWGYLGKNGEMAITPQFEDAYEFRDGMAPVKVNGKWGYIDTKGEIVIKPEYELSAVYELLFFHEGLARVELNGKIGYINKKGEIVIQPRFNGGTSFNEGLASVQLEGKSNTVDSKWGYIDTTGKVVLKKRWRKVL